MTSIVSISGKDYELDTLDATARQMASNVAAADERLRQLRAEINMIQLARDVCAQTLVEHLPAAVDQAKSEVH